MPPCPMTLIADRSLPFPFQAQPQASQFLENVFRVLNLNYCRFDGGDIAFIILAGALVFLMVPGLGTWCNG